MCGTTQCLESLYLSLGGRRRLALTCVGSEPSIAAPGVVVMVYSEGM